MTQECVEHEELPYSVQHVQTLDKDVGCREVVSVEPASDQTAYFGECVLDPDTAARSVISLR